MLASLVLALVVPAFECPDAEIDRTYDYRWRAFERHIETTAEGRKVITEFLPKVPWAGKYNTIVCAAGHHLREARWLEDRSVAADYARFWFGPDGGHRFTYSTWLASAILDVVRVTGDKELATSLLDGMVTTYERWEQRPIMYSAGKGRMLPMGGDGKGMFTALDNREGTEISLSGHGYRPLFNAAMYGEAKAIATIAALAGRKELAAKYSAKAKTIEEGLKTGLWSKELSFFTALDYSGKRVAVRELHGYAPWYFGVPLKGYDAAWKQLEDEQGFVAPFGLTFPERRAAGFVISYEGHECQWNGPSWPFATSIALTALANAIAEGSAGDLGRETFVRELHRYAAQQVLKRADGTIVPWVDEDLNPFTGEWIARAILQARGGTKAERGEDYNHSTFADIVISGLCGVRPRLDGTIEVRPLIPANWKYLRLTGVPVRGRRLDILWDADGSRYGKGMGYSVWLDGQKVHSAASPDNCTL